MSDDGDGAGNDTSNDEVPTLGSPAGAVILELSAKEQWRQRRLSGIKSRWEQLVDGELSVNDLDDEELAKGRCRDKDGGFGGRPPKMVPRELSDRMRSELLARGQSMFAEHFQTAIKVLAEIALDTSGDAKAADRRAAAQYLIERVAGKVPDKIEVRSQDPWQQIMDDILVDNSMEPKAASTSPISTN